MGVVRHPGSIGVRRRPDRSVSLDARNPESVMDQEVLGAALSQRDDKGVEPYFGWAQPGADFLGGVLSPDPVAYGWVDGALSQYHPEDGGPLPVDPLVLQRLQAELPWGRLRSGAQALGRLGSAVARPVVRMNPRGLVGGRAAVQAASPRPVVPMRPPAAPSTAATRAGRVGWVEPPPRLPPPSGRLGSVPSSQLSASARSGRHGWVEPPAPRPPSPAVAGRLGSPRPPSPAVAAGGRPVGRVNPGNVDDWVEARRLNVQPSDSADFYFRTERPQLGNLRVTPSEVPAGSRYYRDPEGLVSRFKTKETAAQTLKPDQHGWIDPGRYRFLDEAAADLVARQIREPSRALARFEWGGGQLRVVDVVSGRPVGVVSDVPRVGFSPFGNWSDGRTHLGDRIIELGKGV